MNRAAIPGWLVGLWLLTFGMGWGQGADGIEGTLLTRLLGAPDAPARRAIMAEHKEEKLPGLANTSDDAWVRAS